MGVRRTGTAHTLQEGQHRGGWGLRAVQDTLHTASLGAPGAVPVPWFTGNEVQVHPVLAPKEAVLWLSILG